MRTEKKKGIHRFIHLMRRSLGGVRRHPWLHLFSLFTLSAAFLSFLATWSSATNLSALFANWVDSAELTVYLTPTAGEEKTELLVNAVRAIDGVQRVDLLTAASAKERFAESMGEFSEITRTLPDSTFPATLEIFLTSQWSHDQARRRHLAGRLNKVDIVEEVELYDHWYDRLLAISLISRIAVWSLGLIALIVAVLVVGAVVRTSVGARQREIEVLRLVGATEQYVRFPFLLEGALQGVLAMLVAVVSLHFLLGYIQELTGDILPLLGVAQVVRLGPGALTMMLIGSALAGVVGARFSLRKA